MRSLTRGYQSLWAQVRPDFFASFTENPNYICDIVFLHCWYWYSSRLQRGAHCQRHKSLYWFWFVVHILSHLCSTIRSTSALSLRTTDHSQPIRCFGLSKSLPHFCGWYEVDQGLRLFTRNQRSITCNDEGIPQDLPRLALLTAWPVPNCSVNKVCLSRYILLQFNSALGPTTVTVFRWDSSNTTENMFQHRDPSNLVKNLRQIWFHTVPFSSSKIMA